MDNGQQTKAQGAGSERRQSRATAKATHLRLQGVPGGPGLAWKARLELLPRRGTHCPQLHPRFVNIRPLHRVNCSSALVFLLSTRRFAAVAIFPTA
jgi:hypothetical protein